MAAPFVRVPGSQCMDHIRIRELWWEALARIEADREIQQNFTGARKSLRRDGMSFLQRYKHFLNTGMDRDIR